MSTREIVRNIILNTLPNKISFNINICKNINIKYLEPEMSIVKDILKIIFKKNDRLPISFDIGANLGLYSYILSQKSESVHCFEPNPKLYKYLKRVLPKNCIVYNYALSNNHGSAQLHIIKTNSFLPNWLVEQDALGTIEDLNPLVHNSKNYLSSISVESIKLDELIQKKNITSVDFIKIDVEGHEENVLIGSKYILDKYRPVILMEISKLRNPNALSSASLLIEKGYKPYFIRNNRLNLFSIIDYDNIKSENFFFIHENQEYRYKDIIF